MRDSRGSGQKIGSWKRLSLIMKDGMGVERAGREGGPGQWSSQCVPVCSAPVLVPAQHAFSP